MNSIIKSKLMVQLSSDIDYSRLESFSRNQLLLEYIKPVGNCYFEIESITKAKQLVTEFIQFYDLASSNYCGGRVVDDNYNLIAYISYNGRVWDSDNHKIAKKICL
jgi:hypothetical protein